MILLTTKATEQDKSLTKNLVTIEASNIFEQLVDCVPSFRQSDDYEEIIKADKNGETRWYGCYMFDFWCYLDENKSEIEWGKLFKVLEKNLHSKQLSEYAESFLIDTVLDYIDNGLSAEEFEKYASPKTIKIWRKFYR